MDWHLITALIVAMCAVVGVVTPIIWVFLSAMFRPLRDDIHDLKKDMKELSDKVKPIEHILLLVNECINRHTESCGERTEAKISNAIRHHEERHHRND